MAPTGAWTTTLAPRLPVNLVCLDCALIRTVSPSWVMLTSIATRSSSAASWELFVAHLVTVAFTFLPSSVDTSMLPLNVSTTTCAILAVPKVLATLSSALKALLMPFKPQPPARSAANEKIRKTESLREKIMAPLHW